MLLPSKKLSRSLKDSKSKQHDVCYGVTQKVMKTFLWWKSYYLQSADTGDSFHQSRKVLTYSC